MNLGISSVNAKILLILHKISLSNDKDVVPKTDIGPVRK